MNAKAGSKAVVIMKNFMVTTKDTAEVVITILFPVTTMKVIKLC